MKNITVIKIGGSTLGKGDTTFEDIVALQRSGKALVVVHGGGRTVTDWLERQGIETKFIRGERVTDLPALEVATAVLAGLVNKEIVAAINSLGGKAAGISGVDGLLVEASMKNREMGYVGEAARVNPAILEVLLQAGFIPVVSPMSLYSVDRAEDALPIINVNGDPFAGDIAAALGAEKLVFLTDVAGISDETGKVIPELPAEKAEALINSGVVTGGMIPKIHASLKALNAGTVSRIIDGKQPHALLKELEGRGSGTTIYRG